MTVAQLKNELEKRGAKKSGKKQDLVDRLEAYDQNMNFGKQVLVDKNPFSMVVSPPETYKDINVDSSIPLVTMDTVNSYLDLFDQAISEKIQEVDGQLKLNENHIYYYQVQGTLLCIGRRHCHFIVWTHKDLRVILVPREDEFIQSMICTLNHFYFEYFEPHLVEKFVYLNTGSLYVK
ncbi:hypothetical protein CAPTEDRAFT_198786 [Capitella teleta]|uniref:SAP domain-containing protein n=1 Tax=Capitella teleta TaxID=283909 RepID=R7TDH6_CAPTE|nr:hypothetical protein CAPTEDRAFT_198786 [Capitella teleta]|eukprot:ELT89116.1 hypothetical protein CAPTEDRAFT_198786 [Capitella teleta]